MIFGSKCVRKLVFESENVYVKTISTAKEQHKDVPDVMIFACEQELATLSEFASLSSNEFI